MQLFSRETYHDRREHLMKQLADDGLVWILGNQESPKNYRDNTYTYRQDSNFLYYAGISRPGLSLMLDLKANKSYLCGDDLTLEDIVWTGPQTSMQDFSVLIGTDGVLTQRELISRLSQAKSVQAPIHFLPPYRGHNQIQIADVLSLEVQTVPHLASRPLIEAIIGQRAIKEAQELVQIELALQISRKMHLEVFYEARPECYEYDLMGKLMAVAAGHNVDTAYPVILTINGQTLHNHDHHHLLREGQLLLGDFGAESPMYYASDITRTIPVSREFSAQQREIYQLVEKMLQSSVEQLQPGRPYLDVHLHAAKVMVDGLIALGLMQGDVDEIVAAGAHALFFPHGLGHMLGLDVHDMEDLGEDLVGYDSHTRRSEQFGTRSLRLGRSLEPGFVLTVEPGIYFIPELIDQWKSKGQFNTWIDYDRLENYRKFGGIRIEDNYTITANGSRLLGDPIPKSLEEISFIRSVDKYIS